MTLTEPAFECKRVRSSSTWQHGTRAQLGTCQLTAHGAACTMHKNSSMGSQLTGPQLGPSPMLLLLTLLHLNAGSVNFIKQSADLYGSHLWLS